MLEVLWAWVNRRHGRNSSAWGKGWEADQAGFLGVYSTNVCAQVSGSFFECVSIQCIWEPAQGSTENPSQR